MNVKLWALVAVASSLATAHLDAGLSSLLKSKQKNSHHVESQSDNEYDSHGPIDLDVDLFRSSALDLNLEVLPTQHGELLDANVELFDHKSGLVDIDLDVLKYGQQSGLIDADVELFDHKSGVLDVDLDVLKYGQQSGLIDADVELFDHKSGVLDAEIELLKGHKHNLLDLDANIDLLSGDGPGGLLDIDADIDVLSKNPFHCDHCDGINLNADIELPCDCHVGGLCQKHNCIKGPITSHVCTNGCEKHPVPEPETYLMMGSFLLAAIILRARRRTTSEPK